MTLSQKLPKTTRNTDIYFMIHNSSKTSYKVATKTMLQLGVPATQGALLKSHRAGGRLRILL